jgi:ketosteroid isomerase-like protein
MDAPDYVPSKAAARANRAFYKAFEKLDLDAMRAAWLDDPMIKCIHPGGEVLTGPERVLASWAAIFQNTAKIRFEIADLSIEILGDMAWATSVERIRSSTDEGLVHSEAAATNLFVKRGEEWKLVLHHASPIARHFFRE